MAIEDLRAAPSRYSEKLAALIETETQMGERAALLAELADALCYFPDAMEIGANHITLNEQRIEPSEWPSLRDIAVMVHTWREQRADVSAMWDAMSADERAGCNAPPVAGGADVTRAWV